MAAVSNTTQVLEEITELERLEEISEKWQRLCDRCACSTPFLTPAWLIPWWRQFASGKLWALALWSEGDLLGLAPFYFHPGPDGITRQVTFVGTGISDYLDILIDPRALSYGPEFFLQALLQCRADWDECDLIDVKPDSPLVDANVPPGLRARVSQLSACPVALLPCSMKAYLKKLPSSHRRKSTRERRKLEEMGGIRLEMADDYYLPGFLTDFFRLHNAWWKERGDEGVLTGKEMQAFHREAASRLLKAGWLRFFRLLFYGTPIAYLYGFEHRKRFYSYLGAFDPKMERYSPGVVIILMVIEECIRNGVREFDFLRGKEEYKYLWGAQDTFTYRYYLKHA